MDFPKHFILEDEKLPIKSIKPKSPREPLSHCAWKERDWSQVHFPAAYVTLRASWLGRHGGRRSGKLNSKLLYQLEGGKRLLLSAPPSFSKLHHLQSLQCLIKMDETKSLTGKFPFLLTQVLLSGETCTPVSGPLLSGSSASSQF